MDSERGKKQIHFMKNIPFLKKKTNFLKMRKKTNK